MSSSQNPFYVPVQLGHTALLLSDVQTQILARFSLHAQATYLANIKKLLKIFHEQILAMRASPEHLNSQSTSSLLITHYTLLFNLNNNTFVSPCNKLAKWVRSLEVKGYFAGSSSDPHYPDYAIPDELVPEEGWGASRDEIVLGKFQPNCCMSSNLLKYFHARNIRHVVLVGLTTMCSFLGSARGGADLDFHTMCQREAIIDDDAEVDEFHMTKILPKFVDVVGKTDILSLMEKQ